MVADQSKDADMARSCLAKRRYWSSTDALVMASRRHEQAGSPALATYHCRNCGGWHLTRRT